MKKLFTLVMALLTLFTALPSLAEEPAAEPVVITIFHTNDVHGRYNSEAGMGYAMMASYVNEARKSGNVLVLDAGDTLHGTIFANAVKGESIVEIMNTIGFDAMAPGNHDFNYGYDRLKELEAMMDFPLVSANIRLKDGKQAFEPYTILEIAGKRIGVVGADNPEMVTAIHPDHTAALSFLDASFVDAAVQAVRAEGVDAVIVLAHWGCDGAYEPNSVQALATIPGVDIVIDGHSHTILDDIQQLPDEKSAIVTSTGEYLNYLGKATFTFTPEGGLMVEAELIPNPGRFEDHAVLKAIGEVEAAQSAELDKVVGESAVDLMGERAVVRTSESNWGNLATDIFIDATGAEVAFMNGGNIRATTPAGPITMRDVNTVFPFGNLVVLMEVSGQAILDALEVGVRLYPETNGGFPQVGGMTVRFDPAAEPGARVTEVLVRGEPIDPDALYKLATNDFLAAGGDGYESLAKFPVLFYMGAMDEVVVDYLRENSPVSPVLEGRIAPVE
ncbi:MAG: bifunctional metallophosphatase/5'-nucleotidase [Firmicutes bacterium]|nr:bifunctional metallophosphatase/5'-nucleotidase [Bacillota bacterium]